MVWLEVIFIYGCGYWVVSSGLFLNNLVILIFRFFVNVFVYIFEGIGKIFLKKDVGVDEIMVFKIYELEKVCISI